MNLYVYIAVIYTLALFLASCFLLYYYKSLEKKEKRLHLSEEKVIEYTQKKSEAILAETLDRARAILETNTNLQDDFLADIKKNLASIRNDESSKDIVDQVSKSYQKVLDRLTKEHQSEAKSASKTVEEITASELEEFKRTIKDELSLSHHFISQKVKEEFSASESEIENYKKKKLESIEETAKKIVKQVTLYAVKKQIKDDDQEQLILEALKLAKKEGVFSDL